MHLVVDEAGNKGRFGKRRIGLGVGFRGRIAEDQSRARLLAVDGSQPYGSGVVGCWPGAAKGPLRAGLDVAKLVGADRDAAERLARPDLADSAVDEGEKPTGPLRAADGLVWPMEAGGTGSGRGFGSRASRGRGARRGSVAAGGGGDGLVDGRRRRIGCEFRGR